VVQIRPATASDVAVLKHMLTLAATWRTGRDATSAEQVLADPWLARYVVDWPRPDDAGVIAESGARPVGAAWYRYFDATEPGFGFVAPTTPEVSIAVDAQHRDSGIGQSLLRGLIDVARDRGVGQLSLSVEHDNPARRLYTRTGFIPVGQSATAVTMVLDIAAG
jgi:ribosomal protein S18 acetylase RimI-like enzyme